MSAREVIFRDGPFSLVRTSSLSDEMIALFNATVWGSEGARYEHKGTEEHLKRIGRPVLVELRKDDNLVGTCLFIERDVMAGDLKIVSNMVRYLIGHPDFRGQGLMKKYAAETMRLVRQAATVPTIFSGIVEKANARSYNVVSSVDYHPISTIKTLAFSRFFPKCDPRARLLSDTEGNEMLRLLEERYKDHIMWHSENFSPEKDYYVIRQDGEIVAGVQALPAQWVVRDVPGFTGKVLMRLLPYIPLLKRIFNPSDFQFLAFDYIYYKPGHLKDLIKLMSSVLMMKKYYSGLFWFDERSQLFSEITDHGNLGLLHRFIRGNDSHLMIGFENILPDQIDTFKDYPSFQSSGDFI